jgi:predicted flap endonuclease-1-like 5' DNA nuclease
MFEQTVTAGPGTATYTQHTFEILIMLLGAFLLGLWLGWLLWSKYKQQVETLMLENQSLKGSLTSVNTDLSLAHNKTEMLAVATSELEAEKADLLDINTSLSDRVETLEETLEVVGSDKAEIESKLVSSMASTPESAAVPMEIVHSPVDIHVEDLAVAAPAVVVATSLPEFPDTSVPDMSGSVGIETPEFVTEAEVGAAEATAPVASEVSGAASDFSDFDISEIEATEVAEPEVQVESNHAGIPADLLAEGGIETPEAPSVVESVSKSVAEASVEVSAVDAAPIVLAAAAPSKPDNLKVIEGIGPKIEEILNRNQVFSFSQLAATPVSRIKEMLIAEGSRYAMHDPATWPAQSLLAANAEWENLKAYQTYLNAGKKPD